MHHAGEPAYEPFVYVTPSQQTAVVPFIVSLQSIGSGVAPTVAAVSVPEQSEIARKAHCAPAGLETAVIPPKVTRAIAMMRASLIDPT